MNELTDEQIAVLIETHLEKGDGFYPFARAIIAADRAQRQAEQEQPTLCLSTVKRVATQLGWTPPGQAAPEKCDPAGAKAADHADKAGDLSFQGQAGQEPVGYFYKDIGGWWESRDVECALWHTPLYTAPPAASVPEGYEAIAVKGLGPLIDALERAESKGYLPDAVAEEWAAFDFRAL